MDSGSAAQTDPADVAASAKIKQHGQIRVNGGFMTESLTLHETRAGVNETAPASAPSCCAIYRRQRSML